MGHTRKWGQISSTFHIILPQSSGTFQDLRNTTRSGKHKINIPLHHHIIAASTVLAQYSVSC